MGDDHGTVKLSRPRELRRDEVDLLYMLSSHVNDPAERAAFCCQVDHAVVVEQCARGCPSIVLQVDSSACPRADAILGVATTAEGADTDGQRLYVLLHATGGIIQMMECYRADGEKVASLPPARSLTYY